MCSLAVSVLNWYYSVGNFKGEKQGTDKSSKTTILHQTELQKQLRSLNNNISKLCDHFSVCFCFKIIFEFELCGIMLPRVTIQREKLYCDNDVYPSSERLP